MNRILTFLVGLCLLPLLGTAQTYVNEDFATATGTTPPTGWVQTIFAGDPTFDNWQFSNPAGRVLNAPISNPAAIFDSDNLSSGGGAEDVTLESPVFDASGATVVNLTFDHYFQGGFGGAVFVEAYNGTSWNTVYSTTVSTANPTTENINISTSVAGVSNAQVRFRWTGNYSWYWILDNVLVSSPAANDVAVLSIDQPTSDCNLGATEQVSISVVNLGSSTASNIFSGFGVNGVPITIIPEIIPGPLNPGDTLSYTFTATADLSAVGPYLITAVATVLGDGNNSNDTANTAVEHFATAITPSFVEDFDSYSNGTTIFPEFTNDPNADVDFQVHSGTTTSSATGPTGDLNGSGKYIYTEVSGTGAGTDSRLVSGCIDLSATTAPQLIFSRHLYGSNIDSFEVDIITATGTTNLLKIIGQELTANAAPFITDTIDLTPYAGATVQIAFSGHTAGFNGDISLDEIVIKEIAPFDIAMIGIDLPASGCGLDTAEQVSISIFNGGTMAVSGFPAFLVVTNQTIPSTSITPELISDTIQPGDTLFYTFSATANLAMSGPYSVSAFTALSTDGDVSNDTIYGSVFNVPVVSTFPYVENFENGSGGWIAGGTNSTWELATPANTVINSAASGVNSWITNATGSYNASENSQVLSPCFDLSTLTDPIVRMSVWWNSEFSYDGAVLQSSIDDGATWQNVGALGDPDNWYTDNTISGNPGGQQVGWSGRGTSGSGGWVVAQHSLDSLAGQPSVRLRVGFGSDGSVQDNGFAFDDFEIFENPPFNVGLVALDIPESGCGLDSAEQVTITIVNFGTQPASNFLATLEVINQTLPSATLTPEFIGDTIPSGDTLVYTFTATADLSLVGSYLVGAYTNFTGDTDAANDTIQASVENIPIISVFPYFEDFENGTGGWVAGGTNSSWAYGTPAKNVIMGAASDSNAWTTGGLGTGLYNANENSTVTSVCFDMSAAPANSYVALKVWWNAEFSWDGANLQSTNDNGATWQNVGAFGDPGNWYTDNSINGNPGGSGEGWSGRNSTSNGSGGWVLATHALDTAVVGQASVRFRIAFGSDGSGQDDGFAFDDFGIGTPPVVDLGPDGAACIGDQLSVAANPGETYLWSTGDTTSFISLMNMTGAALTDTLWLSVTNEIGLTASDTVIVTLPAFAPTLTAMADSSVSCFGGTDGVATAMGSGGSGIAFYSWDNGATTSSISGLAAGVYNVTVTDSANCTATSSVTISEPTAISVNGDSIVNALCFGDSTGAILITPSGGTPGYSFLWSNGDTTEDLTGVPAGDYSGILTDANGCVDSSGVITIGQPDSLSVALNNVTDVNCPDDATGAIDITVAGGTAPYSYAWSNGDTTASLSGLAVGAYTGTITDANGCVLVSSAIAIAATDSLPVAAFTSASAGGASVDFTNQSTGGANFAWDFGDGATSTDADPSHDYAANGTFVVSLTVTNDCGSVTTTDTVFMTTVGIEDARLAANIQIYPNPTTGSFEVAFAEMQLKEVEVGVYSLEGRLVYSQGLGDINGFYQHQVALATGLAKGVYVVRVRTDAAVMHQRILLK